jgi:hypothetical protein
VWNVVSFLKKKRRILQLSDERSTEFWIYKLQDITLQIQGKTTHQEAN